MGISPRAPRILAIVTNTADYVKVGYRTGLWLGELTHFWDVAVEAGCAVDIASPSGGRVPIDPESLMLTEMGAALGFSGSVHARYRSRDFMDLLKQTPSVADVVAAPYDALYLAGGHGAMFDFTSGPVPDLVARFYDDGKIVSAVCHGPCGLLEARLVNGQYLVEGRNVTGFSWKEEVTAKRHDAVPYSLEDELRARGAHYTTALLPFATHVVEDGPLITGQNPKSAAGVAKAVVRRLIGEAQSERAPQWRPDVLAIPHA